MDDAEVSALETEEGGKRLLGGVATRGDAVKVSQLGPRPRVVSLVKGGDAFPLLAGGALGEEGGRPDADEEGSLPAANLAERGHEHRARMDMLIDIIHDRANPPISLLFS